MILWTLFRNSLPLQLMVLALGAWGALGANNLYQRHVGASRLVVKIEKKAEADVKTADAVGAAAAAGAGRVRNPYLRRPGQ